LEEMMRRMPGWLEHEVHAGLRVVARALALLVAVIGVAAGCASAASAASPVVVQTFGAPAVSGSELPQYFAVPDDLYALQITVQGAGGGAGYNGGSLGGPGVAARRSPAP
jgi:hypothetical protein